MQGSADKSSTRDDDTAAGGPADQLRAKPRWRPRLCLEHLMPPMKLIWAPTLAGRLQLAAGVQQQLGLQLDAAWQVAACEHPGKAADLSITHPALPGRSFKSHASLIAFLQAMHLQGQPLPGVLEPVPDDVLAHDIYTCSPTAADDAAADAPAGADSPAAGMRHSLRQQQRAERQIQLATEQPDQQLQQPQQQQLDLQQQQQKRRRSQALVGAAVGSARAAPPAPGQAEAAATAAPQQQLDGQQQAKRMRIDAAATSEPGGSSDCSSWRQQQLQLALPDGRLPCSKTLEQLQKQIASQLQGAQLDSDWVAYPASHAHPRQDMCVLHPSCPNGYFRSARAVGVYLLALEGYVCSLGAGLIVPGLATASQQQRQLTPAQAEAVAAQVEKALLLVGRSYTPLSAAAIAFFERQRLALARGSAGAATGQQRRQLQQRPAAGSRPSSSAGSSSGPAAAAAAAARPTSLDLQLSDGRLPCKKTHAAVMQQVTTKQLGWALDSQWLVYAPRDAPPKLDTLIKHPSLPPGYFRSARGLLAYLDALIPLVQRLGRDVSMPGLVKQQQGQQAAVAAAGDGRQEHAVGAAILQALKASGGGFVWRGPGSTVKQAAVTRHRLLKPDGDAPAAAAAGGGGGSSSGGAAAGSSGGGGRGTGYGAGYGIGSGYGDMDCLPAGVQQDVMVWRHPPIDREYELPPKGCAVLVLGMVFASAAAAAAAHAGMAHHRDRARLMQLRAGLGYRPHSFDRDNPESCAHQGLHVQGNFNSTRGARDVTLRFPCVKFRAIFCDYFRMPTGYACDVYKPQLFTQFVPELIRRGAAEPGVPIYVPNNPVLLKQLAAAGAFTGYAEVVALPGECYPLFKATELAQAAGELQGGYTNATEARQLPDGSEFVVLRCYTEAPAAGGRADKPQQQ